MLRLQVRRAAVPRRLPPPMIIGFIISFLFRLMKPPRMPHHFIPPPRYYQTFCRRVMPSSKWVVGQASALAAFQFTFTICFTFSLSSYYGWLFLTTSSVAPFSRTSRDVTFCHAITTATLPRLIFVSMTIISPPRRQLTTLFSS